MYFLHLVPTFTPHYTTSPFRVVGNVGSLSLSLVRGGPGSKARTRSLCLHLQSGGGVEHDIFDLSLDVLGPRGKPGHLGRGGRGREEGEGRWRE